MSSHERFNKVKELNLCINCLKAPKHNVQSCPSQHCKKCNKPHHTLLHHYKPPETQNVETSLQVPNVNETSSFHVFNRQPTQILLPTVVVLIKTGYGNYIECRALLDSGSQSHFITASFAKRLNISQSRSQSQQVTGINQNTTSISEQLITSIKSK